MRILFSRRFLRGVMFVFLIGIVRRICATWSIIVGTSGLLRGRLSGARCIVRLVMLTGVLFVKWLRLMSRLRRGRVSGVIVWL